MKKFIKVLLFCLCFSIFLTGCGKTQEITEETQEEEEETKPEKEKKKKKDKKKDKEEKEEEVTPEVKEEKDVECVLLKDFDRVVLKKGDETINIFSLKSEDDFIEGAELVAGYIYVFEDVLCSDDDFWTTMHIYDLDGKEYYTYEMNCNASMVDVIELDGRTVYVTFYQGTGGRSRVVYTFSPETKDFLYDEEYTAMCETLDKNGITFGENNFLDALNNKSGDIYGWSVTEKTPVRIDRDTLEIKEYYLLDYIVDASCSSIVGDTMLIRSYNPDTYYLLNMKDYSVMQYDSMKDYVYLDKDESNYYLYRMDKSEYGLNSYYVCKLDSVTKDAIDLYYSQVQPGYKQKFIMPGVTGFTLANNHIYCVDTDSESYFWGSLDLTDNTISEEKIGRVWYDFADILEISSSSGSLYEDDESDVPYYNSYIEKPQIKNGLSEHSDIINEAINHYVDDEVGALEESVISMAKSNASTNRNSIYTYSIDFYVTGARLIGNDYIAIDFKGYCCMGKTLYDAQISHSMLFKRSTGELLELSDICGVDEKMYARIVATKAIQTARESAEYSYGIADYDDSKLFEEIMKDINSFDRYTIRFDENGIVVEVDSTPLGVYYPARMDVLVEYDELNIELE